MKRNQLADHLESMGEDISRLQAVTGFDGFVDEMITLVEERQSLDAYRRVENISQFGDLVKRAAGHSSLREIVVTAMHPGGCAVNMGDGLAAMGIRVDTFATLGEPIHPAFSEYGSIARLHSWGREPGRTLAFEFADGKLMFSAVTQLAEFNTDSVSRYMKDGAFLNACEKAGLIALTDWTLYPHMTSVWRLLGETVFRKLEDRPWLFIDLVDPSSRSEADIRDMLAAMREFTSSMRVVLGLNQNEANILSRISGDHPVEKATRETSSEQAAGLRKTLGLEQVVIHAHAYAVCACKQATFSVDGPYCERPKKSTGAGDRFNAGYALGLMLDLTPVECLTTAVASSGFFVRNAHSASLPELIAFLKHWECSAQG